MIVRAIQILAICLAFVGPIYGQSNAELRALAEAERTFAAETVREGFRDGFIKYFADDGIGFGPHPERTKEVLQKQPPESEPRTLIFNWAPMFGDISAAGDLGYTTGPVLFTPQGANAKPPFHGIYFSVWQKQADGAWKVVVDMGVSTPGPVAPITTEFTPPSRIVTNQNFGAFATRDLAALENKFTRYIGEHGMAKAYANWLDREQFRVHRKGRMPIVREGDLADVLKTADIFEFMGGKVARSNDLAFAYGKYVSPKSVAETETGYYVHVWRRDAENNWKLVIDVQNPLPKEKK